MGEILSKLTPAIWSAVAASFAALSSFLIMLIQRRNLYESARPELVMDGWTRQTRGTDDSAHEVISFTNIRNIGRGPALNIHINSFAEHDNRPTAVMSTCRLPILAANEILSVAGEIVVWWKNVPPQTDGLKLLFIEITILCWGARNVRYDTTYNLFVVPLSPTQGVTNAIAPGVALHNRTVVERPIWLLKTRSLPRRLLGLPRRLLGRRKR